MNKVTFYFTLTIATLAIFSCSKSNNDYTVEPIRDFSVQYTTDKTDIEEYLQTNYISILDHSGFSDDQDVTISKTATSGAKLIWAYKDATTYPKLLSRPVNLNGVDYTLYYLVLRPGTGESPCNVDGVLASYRGDYLYRTTETTVGTVVTPSELTATKFEESKFPQIFFSLYNTIIGWSEVFPQFKTGDKPILNEDGTVTYNNFGAGVMFIPSGLAYYNNPSGSIPSYSPLVFSFKLYAVQRLDQDGDGVPSYQEDKNNDGYVYDFRSTYSYPVTPSSNIDDTDKDGIPDFLDIDDDADGYTTKVEITKPTGSAGPSKYYPFNAFTVADDPLTTTIDESLLSEPKGIPAFISTGVYDYTTPGRLRIHLDSANH